MSDLARSFMVFASGLDGLASVKLLENHNTRQMVRKGHRAHGQFKICPGFYSGCHAKGGTDEKTGTAFTGKLYFTDFTSQGFGGKQLSFRRKYTEPCPFRNFREDKIRFLFQACADLSRGGILRQTMFRKLQQLKTAISSQPLFIFRCGGDIKFFFQLAHGNEGNIEQCASHPFRPII